MIPVPEQKQCVFRIHMLDYGELCEVGCTYQYGPGADQILRTHKSWYTRHPSNPFIEELKDQAYIKMCAAVHYLNKDEEDKA